MWKDERVNEKDFPCYLEILLEGGKEAFCNAGYADGLYSCNCQMCGYGYEDGDEVFCVAQEIIDNLWDYIELKKDDEPGKDEWGRD